uniref:Putative secreted protein n=1 Tax=Ixodes ricinus TaxID=34613 RepID=A0A131Y608_IXORI
MDYVLVKVERGSDDSSLHNILLELPATPTIPSVSVASCYFDKCSHSVSTMVKTKKDGLPVPTEVEVTPSSEEEALMSWTTPDETTISAME